MQPSEVRNRNLIDGRVSISFSDYKAVSRSSRLSYNGNDNEAFSDEEEIRNHTLAVLISDDEEDNAEQLCNNLNYYFQDDCNLNGEREMPYPQQLAK
ncbi:hypothetical protein C4D60_Mb00t04880 [Musa balbisiana]|uniref:Uncharacterized protein n=1 Tax=Musa balbisiana TaxID=52838 RepID=A0A4S8I5V2_MUSBA|nr:hypothetical protein C4D60_Mb00t04880 [Musa balbisiana]